MSKQLDNISTKYHIQSTNYQHGFTIVELLVVIVVIGILAAITIVTYGTVSQRAISASLQSDLANDVVQLKAFQIQNGVYPTSVTDCPTPSNPAITICLKNSPGNTIVGYSANPNPSSPSFYLVNQNGSSAYSITDTTKPKLANTTQPNTTPGAILELHAAKANNGLSQGINSPLTTTWKDTSGNNNDGTLTNFGSQTPWGGSGTSGDPAYLSRPSDSGNVTVAGSSSFKTATFTAEQWVWNAANDTTYRPFLDYEYVSSSSTYGFIIMRYSTAWYGVLGAYVGKSNSIGWSYLAWPSDSAPTESWTHVILVYDGSYGDVYINNVRKAHTAFTYAPMPDSNNANMYVNGSSYPGSRVAVTRIYPFALTATQITANYNAGTGW